MLRRLYFTLRLIANLPACIVWGTVNGICLAILDVMREIEGEFGGTDAKGG